VQDGVALVVVLVMAVDRLEEDEDLIAQLLHIALRYGIRDFAEFYTIRRVGEKLIDEWWRTALVSGDVLDGRTAGGLPPDFGNLSFMTDSRSGAKSSPS
jgi:hypothetical protein